MPFCLIPKYADKFKEALRSGEITPEKLINMTSEQRRTYLAKFVGEFNAKEANALLESKLLLKNQQAGLITWAKKLSGITEPRRADLIDKISKLEKALDTSTEQSFLSDIVEKRLGVQVTPEEATQITNLANQAKNLFDPNKKGHEQSREYWQARQQLNKYMREIEPVLTEKPGYGRFKEIVANVIQVLRSFKVGYDISPVGRQGRAEVGTREWVGATSRIYNYAKSQKAMDSLEVDIMSNKYADQLTMVKRELGLTILGEKFTAREEQFASRLSEKIPGLKAAERVYVGFLNDLRFHKFVNILENLDLTGKGITDNVTAMKDLAKVIGAATGRGTLGIAEGAARPLSAALFSPRWIASRVEMILNPLTKTGPARIEAVKSLARLVGTSAAILTLYKAAGFQVETDTRSSDFGKIKVGNTRFDVTGGLAPYIVLFSRVGPVFVGQKIYTKSTITGKLTEINSGKYGASTAMDVLTSFVEGKTSPMASVVRDILNGTQFGGTKTPKVGVTKDFLEYLTNQLFTPLLASDAIQAYQDSAGGPLRAVESTIGSFIGVGVNTYSKKK